jgi:protein SCO1/2
MSKLLGSLFLLAGLLLICAPGPSLADGAESYQSTLVNLNIPDVVLVNQEGEKVRLKPYLESSKAVVVDFVYATCTTICPILSAGFTNLQRQLGEDNSRVRLVSITIDPEHDTPPIMKEYLERYRAKPGWDFLTGTRADINRVMKGFDAYFPEKMSHRPLYFIRAGTQGKWVRIEGLVDGQSLLKEIDETVNK